MAKTNDEIVAAGNNQTIQDYLLVEVKDYAVKNYETGGWDYLIECQTDADILKAIGAAKTIKGALRKVSKKFGLRLLDERRREIMNEIF